MKVIIEEIIDRSAHGQTQPFICRGSDQAVYFVKGRSAGRESQIKEYLCGRLGQAFGLPIPDFTIAHVPQALIDYGGRSDLGDLGAGPAFASRKVDMSTELTMSQLQQVPQAIAKDLLLFDWWIQNEDRSLGDQGGNPNLLWSQENDRLVVIDHNLAFDPGFDVSRFVETHIFRSLIPLVFDDMVERMRYVTQMENAVTIFKESCDNLPEIWLEEAPVWCRIEDFRQLLGRYAEETFWKIEP